MVEITYTYLLSIARYGAMHWDFPKLHGGKVALILSLIVQMLQKVMADSNTKNAIPNALRNGRGFHEWFPVSMADKAKKLGFTASELKGLTTPTSDV